MTVKQRQKISDMMFKKQLVAGTQDEKTDYQAYDKFK